ncbi:TonB-dependent receptor [Niveispirillum sp.]|uniref:TonB-dependent receptor n=1 Tax=Niveispirillum sp. TaxID=1917217 RepID=UPI001B47C8EE|nr:TonB-dependent receptor [Niveispirillum sp.]MBP7340618.1 TonB-dependent receptor [Niveispirillum sp.]
MSRSNVVCAGTIALLALSNAAVAQPVDATMETEIIVTGEKVARSLQDTAASVAVTTGQRLEEENIQSLQEIIQRTANMAETYGSSGFTIRGIADRGVSGGGDAPLATIYLDGAALPDGIVGAGPTDTWDLAQIEIFRGPQSTLQGLNALAGAIVLRSQDPTFHWDLKGRAILSKEDTTSFALAGGGPLVADELAFRIAAEKRDSDNFIHNVTRNTPEEPLDSTNLRAKLLWTPDALPGLEARLGYTHFKKQAGYTFTYASTAVPDYYDNRVAYGDYPNSSDTRADIVNLELDYDIADRTSLSAVSNYSDVDHRRAYDGDNTAQPVSYGVNPARYKTFSQELRLHHDADWLKGLLGAYYYHRDQQASSESRTLVPTPANQVSLLLQGAGFDAATAGQLANLYVNALPTIPVQYSADLPMKVETMALFADGRLELTDQFSVLAGLRYDHERNIVTVTQTAAFAGTYPDPAAFGPYAPLITAINGGVQGLVDQASGATPRSTRNFNAWLPKLGAEWAWTDDLSTTFLVQRGYRSGGTTANTARSQAFSYDPEFTWNYELSLRSQWLDGRLTLNANAYYIDWKDQQTTVNFGLNLYDYHTVNAGKSHVYGGEVELTHKISSDIDWYASLGHTRTKFDEFQTNVGSATDLSGLEFPYAPRWTLAAGVNVRFGDGFALNVNGSHRSEVFGDVSRPQENMQLEARTLVNTKLAYEYENWTVSVFANNLFDEKYKQYEYAAAQQALLGAPRVVGVMLEGRL